MAKKTAVVSFGRMSPPTNGHEKLVNAVTSIARKENGDAQIYVSHSYDKKKNPLKYEDKVRFLKTAFGPIVKQSTAKTFIDVAKSLSGKFENLVFVVGSDRVPEFERVLNKYNGSEFNFASVKVVSAGERDPDADDVSGMSASKMRSFVSAGDFESFKSGLPKKLIPHAKEVYDMTKEGMGLHEGLEDDEVLVEETLDEAGVVSLQQRRKRGLKMRAIKGRLKMARERAKRRMASGEKLKQRAARKARMSMRSRMSGGKKYSDMSASQKMAVDKRMERIPDAVIKRIAQRQLPIVRRAEIARLSNLRSGGSSDKSTTMKKYMNGAKTEAWDVFIKNTHLKEAAWHKVEAEKHRQKRDAIHSIKEAWDNFMTEGVRTPMNRGMMNTARKALANNAKGNIRWHGPSGTWRIHGEDGKVVKTGQKFFQRHQAQAWYDENSPKD
jgi:hypothetical protein